MAAIGAACFVIMSLIRVHHLIGDFHHLFDGFALFVGIAIADGTAIARGPDVAADPLDHEVHFLHRCFAADNREFITAKAINRLAKGDGPCKARRQGGEGQVAF